MTSPPDMQNVPDIWGLLEEASGALKNYEGEGYIYSAIDAALSQSDRFVLVPKEKADEYEVDGSASHLIDVWAANYGQMPWAKAVEVVAIVKHLPAEERLRLLALDDAAPKPEGKPESETSQFAWQCPHCGLIMRGNEPHRHAGCWTREPEGAP